MKKISIGLVTCLLVQPVLADSSMFVLGRVSDNMIDRILVAAGNAKKESPQHRANKKPGDGSSAQRQTQAAPVLPAGGASSAGSGGGGQQPPNGGNWSPQDDLTSMSPRALIVRLRMLLLEMQRPGIMPDEAVRIQNEMNRVAAEYGARSVIRYAWFLGDGWTEVQNLLGQARAIVTRLTPIQIVSGTNLESDED